MTLQLMMMHHNTEFGDKIFFDLEDIVWTNTDILTLHCDLDFESSNPFFSKDTLTYYMYHHVKLGCGRINSSEDIAERVIF